MPLTWSETVYLTHGIALETVASRLAEQIERRGPVGSPLAPGDRAGSAVAEATSVRFSVPFRRGVMASVGLSGTPTEITADYSVPLPSGFVTALIVSGLAVMAWGLGKWFGEPFGGGLAFGLVWVFGGM